MWSGVPLIVSFRSWFPRIDEFTVVYMLNQRRKVVEDLAALFPLASHGVCLCLFILTLCICGSRPGGPWARYRLAILPNFTSVRSEVVIVRRIREMVRGAETRRRRRTVHAFHVQTCFQVLSGVRRRQGRELQSAVRSSLRAWSRFGHAICSGRLCSQCLSAHILCFP